MFGVVFTFEVFLKIAALRCRFVRSAWNVFDVVIISSAWFSMYANVTLPINPMLLRLLRLVKLLRLLKKLNHIAFFDDLQLMVRALQAGAPVLIWIVVLVIPAIACISLGMNYTLAAFIADETKPMKDRVACFNYFGTFTKSMLSMFEVTFGSWVPICRFLHGKVDERFALFFMCYQLGMGIAVLRVVYGVFLHVTFRCAGDDEDLMIAQKTREETKFADKIREVFKRFDTSGDGYMSRDEFRKISQNRHVKTLLSAMNLDMNHADLLFQLCDDDGQDGLSVDEMVFGFSRFKGYAQSLGVAELLQREVKAMDKIEQLMKLNVQMATKIGLDTPAECVSGATQYPLSPSLSRIKAASRASPSPRDPRDPRDAACAKSSV